MACAVSSCVPVEGRRGHREGFGQADQRGERRPQVVRQRGEQRVAQPLGFHLDQHLLGHLDVMHALEGDRGERRERVELPLLLGDQQDPAILGPDREHAARSHRRAQRQVQEGVAGEGIGAKTGGLRLVVGPLRGADVDGERGAPLVADGDPFLVVRNQHRHFGPERLGDEPGGGVHHQLRLEQARQVAGELVEGAGALLAIRRDPRLIPEAGGHLSDDERDGEHHGECQQVLRVAHRERHARRHAEEVERRHADESRQHRRAAPEFERDQHDRQQEQHDDVGELEVRQQRRGDDGGEGARGQSPGVSEALGIAARVVRIVRRRARRRPVGYGPFAAADFDQVDVGRGIGHALRQGPRPRPRALRLAASGDDLRAIVRSRVVDDKRDGIPARQNRRLRTELVGELDGSQDALALRRGEPLQCGRLDVDGGPLDTELGGEARCAPDEVVASGARPDATQQRCFGFPDAPDCLVRAIGLDVVLDAVRRAAQRELAQCHQVALAEEVARRALDLLGKVHLAGLQAGEQIVGGNVDQYHLVGIVEERVRNGFPDRDAGNSADDVVQALEMLDIECREDVDAARQQLFDVLPPLGMTRSVDVGVRELVDQDQRRTTLQRCVEVELRELRALVLDFRARQDVDVLQQRLGFLAAVGLDDADDDVLAFIAKRPSRGEHRVRLADAGRRAEIDAQVPAPRGGFLRLDFREELVGIGALVLHAGPSGEKPSVPRATGRCPASSPRGVELPQTSTPGSARYKATRKPATVGSTTSEPPS